MTVKTQKNMVLKRAYLPDGNNISLEEIFVNIGSQLPNHEDRVSQQTLLKSYVVGSITKDEDAGVYVRILCYENGSTGLINFVKSKETAEVEEHEAPENTAWLDDQILLYIKDNHIIGCNLGFRENFLALMISDFAKKSEAVNDDFLLNISDVANKDEVDKVNQIGVKEIDLGISNYLSSLDNLKNVSENPFTPILKKLFGMPNSKDELKKRASATAKIKLTRGGQFKKDEIPKDEWLTDIGNSVLTTGLDDYIIKLENGERISSSSLKINKTVRLNKQGNTFSFEDGKVETKAFYKELETKGSIEF
jgi:hypothetical protein